MTILTTIDSAGDTLNLGDHVEIYDDDSQPRFDGEIVQIYKNGKMRVKPEQVHEPTEIWKPDNVCLLYRGDS